MNARVENFTRGFFWFGYAVFLSASIPHIAAYFRHFDPRTTNVVENIFYWTIAVLLAMVIDVSDVLVSIAVMKAQASGAKFRDVSGFWLFILLIMALSWFFNWQYNVVFGTSDWSAVDKNTILGSITVGQLNPTIGSAFQLLLLVYTGMAHKFSQKPRALSLEDLEKEAKEAEKRAEYQARIDAVRKAQRAQSRHNFFEAVRQTKKDITSLVKDKNENGLEEIHAVEEGIQPELSESEEGQSIKVDEEVQSPINEQSIEDDETLQCGNQSELEEMSNDGETTLQPDRWSTFTGRSTVSLEKAAELLDVSINTIISLRNKKALKTAALNRNLITVASLKAYDSRRSNRKQSRRTNEMKSHLKIVHE